MTSAEHTEIRRLHSVLRGYDLEIADVRKAVDELVAQANWAVELLAKNARPYNHEYTCQTRLAKAIGAVERMMAGNGEG